MRMERFVTECGLCGAAMTGAECQVCGWRISAVTEQAPSDDAPAASTPTPPPLTPRATTAQAPRPPGGGKNRTAWVLGGILTAALLVGIIAISTSLGERAGSPASVQQPTGTAVEPSTKPSPSGSAPSVLANSVPDTPRISGWIAVLESIPQRGGKLSHARSLANALHQKYGVDIYVIDSGDYEGLNPGWWAVVMIGFDSNAEARAACSSVGRSPSGSCYGRRVKE